MLLGIMFGYLFFWSGSLWIPIIAHLINNGMAVTVGYLNHLGIINMNIDEPVGYPFYSIILSLVLTILVLLIFYKKSKVQENNHLEIS